MAVAETHEWAAFNGVQAAVSALGRSVAEMAARGADQLGSEEMARLLRAALGAQPDWNGIEDDWGRASKFSLVAFIDRHADAFFVE